MRNIENLDQLQITPQPTMRGEASHQYVIAGFDTTNNRAVRGSGFVPRFQQINLILATGEQYGEDMPPDGITLDALLAVVQNHIEGKLAGPDATMGKQLALEYVKSARDSLAEDQQDSRFNSVGGHNPLGDSSRRFGSGNPLSRASGF